MKTTTHHADERADEGAERVDFAEQFRKNWMIITFIAGLIVTWSNFRNDIQKLNEDYSALKVEQVAFRAELAASQQQLSAVSGDIKEIKTSITFIKERVSSPYTSPYGY